MFQQNSIFCAFESKLIDLSRCVKCGSITGNSRKKTHLCVAVFVMSQPTNLLSVLWGQYFCNLPQNQNPGAMILWLYTVLSCLKLLRFVFFRQLDRSLHNFAVIKAQIFVPQKFYISDFRRIKHNVVGLNTMIAISLLDLLILKVIPQGQVIMLLT